MNSIRNVRFITLMSLMTGMLVGCGAQDEIEPSLENDFSVSPREQTQKAFEGETWDNLLRIVHVYKDVDFTGASKIYKEDVRALSLPFTFRYRLDDSYKNAVKSINLKRRCMMTLYADDDFKAVVRTYGGQNSLGGVLRNYPPDFRAFEVKCWDKTRAYGSLHTSFGGNGDYFYVFTPFSYVPPSFGSVKSIRVNETTYGSGASAILLTTDPSGAPPRQVPVVTTVTRNQNLDFEETGIDAVQFFMSSFNSCQPRPSCYRGPGCTGDQIIDRSGQLMTATRCWDFNYSFNTGGAKVAPEPSFCTLDGLCIRPDTGTRSLSSSAPMR